jgi:polyphosphate kinase 2 (PPK2 family)
LHISKEEQLKRFGDRLNDPTKHWKLSAGDYAERELWDNYMAAFEELLEKCSPNHAPWFIIPADNKWYRDYVISEILVKYLEDMKIGLPTLKEDINEIKRLYAEEVGKE